MTYMHYPKKHEKDKKKKASGVTVACVSAVSMVTSKHSSPQIKDSLYNANFWIITKRYETKQQYRYQ